MVQVKLNEVCKSYEGTDIIKNVNLANDEGEFVVFVGPSGCDKSTLLRLIASITDVTEGDVYIGNKVVNQEPPPEIN